MVFFIVVGKCVNFNMDGEFGLIIFFDILLVKNFILIMNFIFLLMWCYFGCFYFSFFGGIGFSLL